MNWQGYLIYHFMNTILLTALVAVAVLWRYRVGVLAGMRCVGGNALDLPAAAPARPARPMPVVDPMFWEQRTRLRVGLALLASLTPPAIMLALVNQHGGAVPMTPRDVFYVVCIILVLAGPMATVALALPWRRALQVAIFLLVAGAALTTLASIVQRPFLGRAPSVDQLAGFFLFFAAAAVWLWLPLLLMFATGRPRVRGVAPIAFTGLFVFGLAPFLGTSLNFWLTTSHRGSQWLMRMGVNATFLALALPTALFAWWRLKRLSNAYESKRLSDSQLLARTWWLMFCGNVTFHEFDRAPLLALAVPLAAYGLFCWLNGHFLALTWLYQDRPPRRTLLLLRVFGYAARTEKLFDRIGARWRLFGPVTMIAAPDVVARTFDPGDFLRFASGRLATSFITGRASLDAWLAQMDLEPDPDGRYRVLKCCCHEDTWRATVAELMSRADAVLMDLRGLTDQRGGCGFELEQLHQRLPAERIVLAVDGHSDLHLIRAAMPSQPQMVRLDKGSEAETDALFLALLVAAGLQPAPAS